MLLFSAQSNQINKTRLKVLQFRDESLNEIIGEAHNTLISVKNDLDSYSKLLLYLCLDVFYRLMENEVSIECTSDDLELVKIASKKAAELFKVSTMIDVSINVAGIMPEE
jgi:V-type H+-transporting ATPase subunit E